MHHSCHTPLEQHPREQGRDGASTAAPPNAPKHPLLSGNGDISATFLQRTTPSPSSISPAADSCMPFGFSQMPEPHLCWHLCPRAEEGSAELVPREMGAGLG